MPTPAEQLSKLLNYVVEQSKEIDPHGYKLVGHKGFLRHKGTLTGLPGVSFNREVQGDHVWLHIERLEAQRPPVVHPEAVRPLLTVSDDPNGKPPTINDAALAHRIAAAPAAGKSPEQLQQEASILRGTVGKLAARPSTCTATSSPWPTSLSRKRRLSRRSSFGASASPPGRSPRRRASASSTSSTR